MLAGRRTVNGERTRSRRREGSVKLSVHRRLPGLTRAVASRRLLLGGQFQTLLSDAEREREPLPAVTSALDTPTTKCIDQRSAAAASATKFQW